MRGHSLCLLAVLAILAPAAMRADAKPSFTMPEEDADEEEVEVAIEVEVDDQPVVETPVTEPPLNDAEGKAEETPARTSSKGTFSLLLSKGNWFRSFFRPKPAVTMPEEDADDAGAGGETELEPDSASANSAIADGISVGSDDGADDGSERGRRHLPPHWKALSANAAPNKGRRQPLAAPPNKGSSPSKPPNRSYASPVSKPPVDGYTAKPTAPWRPARKTHATKRQWYRRYQSPRQYSRRQWYVRRKYADSKKSSRTLSTAFPNRVVVPNRGNYPNSAWQYSPYNFLSKEPPRKQSPPAKKDGY